MSLGSAGALLLGGLLLAGAGGSGGGRGRRRGLLTLAQPLPRKRPRRALVYRRPFRAGGLPFGRYLTTEQAASLVEAARVLGIDPAWLATVEFKEAGFLPWARNPRSNASGVIQATPKTAKGLGLTTAEIRSWSFERQQKELVIPYYRPAAGRIRSIGDLYVFTFWRHALGKGPGYLIVSKDGESDYPRISREKAAAIYAGHAGADIDGDGRLTAGDIFALIESWQKRGEREAA